MSRTRIGLLLGDPAGVGPEIVAKLLARMSDRPDIRFTVIGTPEMLAAGAEVAGVALPPSLSRASTVPGADGPAPVLAGIPTAETGGIRCGQPSRVAGLNRHAGDGGTIGEEDIEIIAPAVQALKAEGYTVEGPQSPDTVFLGARRGSCDLVVTMYHDQGQIALKAMGFERVVTLLGG